MSFASLYPPNRVEIGPKGQLGAQGPTGPTGPGKFLGTTVLTAGTMFTTGPNTNKIVLRLLGGGGGGGSSQGVPIIPPPPSIATAGLAGGYCEALFNVTPNTTYIYSIGAFGPGGTPFAGDGNNPGHPGGDTTFTVGGTTVRAKGGPGGRAGDKSAVPIVFGTFGVVTSSGGYLNVQGKFDDFGLYLLGSASSFFATSRGPRTRFGAGGHWNVLSGGGGLPAVGFGAGGSGSPSAPNGAGNLGGDGVQGAIIVEEWS